MIIEFWGKDKIGKYVTTPVTREEIDLWEQELIGLPVDDLAMDLFLRRFVRLIVFGKYDDFSRLLERLRKVPGRSKWECEPLEAASEMLLGKPGQHPYEVCEVAKNVVDTVQWIREQHNITVAAG